MRGAFWLRVLADIMQWTDDQAQVEYAWINLMALYKYDSYRDYQAGMRFVESLSNWLQQFEVTERHFAYEFIKHNLVYIGTPEMERMVKQFFYKFVYKKLLNVTASKLCIPGHTILTNSAAKRYLEILQRRTLFMGLSDGARLDVLRRANIGRISNEQVVIATQIDEFKWKSLLKDLKKDLTTLGAEENDKQFCIVYLIDDFMGTGLSFLRKDNERWTGKLIKFLDSIHSSETKKIFSDEFEICVHHFIGTKQSEYDINQRYNEVKNELKAKYGNITVSFSYSMIFPESNKISDTTEEGKKFLELCKKYYNPNIESEHTGVGGGSIECGFGGCALPLILEHNCPNNSVPLLWAEIEKDEGNVFQEMRPLFRRRQRHS